MFPFDQRVDPDSFLDYPGDKTPVTLLHELLTKRLSTPTYTLVHDGSGTHDPLFKYEVSAVGQFAIGSGKSKKEAKHEAARMMLDLLRHHFDLDSINNVNSPYSENIKENAVGMLNDFCLERNLTEPRYGSGRDEGLPHAKLFSCKCSVSSLTTEAEARTKKQAKQLAAFEMLNKLKECAQHLPTVNRHPRDEVDQCTSEIKNILDRGLKKGNTPDLTGIKIADYCKIFLLNIYPKSELLESFMESGKSLSGLEDPRTFCKDVLHELDLQYKVLHMRTVKGDVLTTLITEGAPSWTFLGIGSNLDDAVRKLYLNTLQFIIDMSAK